MASFKPLITIITPTYNAGKYIEKCLSSVQNQTSSEFEHIILDGISTDNTVELVQNWQKQYSNIKLIIEKDAGVYDAMNKGIQLAQSTWLYFLGADDFIFDSSVIQKVIEFLDGKKVQLIYGNVYFESLNKLYDYRFTVEKILKQNICHQSIFYHQSVFKTIGLYDLKYQILADYDQNLKCWLGGKIKYCFVPLTIANYTSGGISSIENDIVFSEHYPLIITQSVLSGNWNVLQKIHLLSKCYRKIIQRYPIKLISAEIWHKKFFFLRILAFLWMCFSAVFYLLKKMVNKHQVT